MLLLLKNQFQLWPFLKSMVVRLVMFWLISSLIRNFFGPKQQQAVDHNVSVVGGGKTYPPSFNMFQSNEHFELFVYLSPKVERFHDFDNAESLFWHERDLFYGDWTSGADGDGSRQKTVTMMPTPEVLQHNGSLYMHVFLVKEGQSHYPRARNYGGREVVYSSCQLNKFKKKYYHKTANLLTGKTEQNALERQKDGGRSEIRRLELLAPEHHRQLPAPLDEAVKFDPTSNRYYPIVFFNNYWNLANEYQPINDTVPSLNFTVTFAPLSLFKWQLFASQQMRGKWTQMFGGEIFEESDADQDAIKQALIETSPVLLGITIFVSILHTVLELLAFKNDIQFWRTRKSLEGLSVRSVLFNIFQSLIVFLYICDNDSSWLIKMSIGFGLLIELWKIPKCLNIEVIRSQPIFGLIPRLRFSDKGSYVESATKDYDQMAFKYLSWALFPLLGCYAVYSLVYDEQKGWYSWILGMLYGFLLTFGFIMMTPQLFINYKLKSVAHLPWRMLTYKFINTFIDDLFAFVIRMPTLYRLGCFRDDIIFLIYIYQRWIYRVDLKRVNEYGTSGDDQPGTTEEVLAIEADSSQLADGADGQSPEPESNTNEESSESKKDK
uniref:Cleft lip and palate associated transmembrane protein 1 n=1 Tax=Globodera pallida TaxID=36090 RepID=A0A183C4C7_GLOPA